MNQLVSRIVLLIGFALICASALADVQYVFTPVNDPNGVSTTPRGINNTGEIVGYFFDANGMHGFLDSGGTFTTVDDPSAVARYAGSIGTEVTGINDNGQMVGYFDDGKGGVHGFLDTGGNFTTLDFPGATRTWIMSRQSRNVPFSAK